MIFDINDMLTWMYGNINKSGWDHFMCMGCILFTSSNFKKVPPFYVGLFKTFAKYMIADALPRSFNALPSSICNAIRKEPLFCLLTCIMYIYLLMLIPWICLVIIPSLLIVALIPAMLLCVVALPVAPKQGKFSKLLSKNNPQLWKRVIAWICFVLYLVCLFGFYVLVSTYALITINIYFGVNYGQSIYLVLEERKTSAYLSYVISNAKSKFRLITWIL